MDIPQQKGTGQQFLAQIQKTPGVKPEELQYTGLDTFLANKPTVTKGEIQDYLDANKVRIEEVVLGKNQQIKPIEQQIKPIEQLTDEELGVAFRQIKGRDVADEYGSDWRMFRKDIEYDLTNPELEGNYYEQAWTMGETKYHLGSSSVKTEIPGGENYREVLLTLPSGVRGATDVEVNALNNRLVANGFDGLDKEAISSLKSGRNDAIAMLEDYDSRLGIRTDDIIEAMQGGMSSNVFRSFHFDQPNILAHMRINDRTIDGKPTMFIEEVQSDWHQAGRKKGYDTPEVRAAEQKRLDDILSERRQLLEEKSRLEELAVPYISQGRDAPSEIVDQWSIAANRIDDLQREQNALSRGFRQQVPDAPFKSTWDELSLKRAIKMASDEGYEQIAFTTGKTQADRYDLSKQVDKIVWNEQNGTFAAQRAGSDTGTIMHKNVTASNLSDYIGKEAAEKLIGAKSLSGWRTIEGEDLRVGGEGMKGFYDKMLPKKLEKIGKKYGAATEEEQY
jgi:hypothetical protein